MRSFGELLIDLEEERGRWCLAEMERKSLRARQQIGELSLLER
jgi:hypothetical protein